MTAEIHEEQLKSVGDIVRFMLSGKARFTLRSKETDKHFTYRVSKVKDADNIFLVSFLQNSFMYMGRITVSTVDAHMRFERTFKSMVSDLTPQYKYFAWFIEHINEDIIHPKLEVWHEGRCGRCGRVLTDPISVKRGVGPECLSRRVA